jgi:hypothetical protein
MSVSQYVGRAGRKCYHYHVQNSRGTEQPRHPGFGATCALLMFDSKENPCHA